VYIRTSCVWCFAIILAPRSGLDCRTTSIARWHGRRPSAATAVVLHRRDRRAGGASYGLVCDPLVDLVYDLAGLLQRPDDPELGPSFHRGCREGSACAAGRSATIALGDDGAVSGARELTQGHLGAGHSTTQRPTTRAASVDRVVLAQRETVRATLSHCAAFADGEKAPQTRARASVLYPGDSVSTV
jgi:hypothetical protein